MGAGASRGCFAKFFIIALLFFINISHTYASDDCLTRLRLNQIELDATYSKALSFEFNQLYNAPKGKVTNRLRSLFNLLGIGGLEGQSDAAAILKSIFSHLNNETSFVDRFYPETDLSIEGITERELKVETLQIFENRMEVLNQLLLKYPLKGNVKLMEQLMDTLLGDFDSDVGFSDLPLEKFEQYLPQAREEYLKPRDETTEESTETFEEKSDEHTQNGVFSFTEWEREGIVQALKDLTPESYKAAQKAVFENFEDLSALENFYFYTVHNAGGNKYFLINAYERGIHFLIKESKNPFEGEKNTGKFEITQSFFRNLKSILTEELNVRFGDKFTSEAQSMLNNSLTQLHNQLSKNSLPRELFPDGDLSEINACFEAIGLEPLSFGL